MNRYNERIEIDEPHTCMPNALNQYFGRRIYDSQCNFYYDNRFNLTLAKLDQTTRYHFELTKRVFVSKQLWVREKVWRSNSNREASFVYDLNKALEDLNPGKYIIDYNYNKRSNERTSRHGHNTCIFKDRRGRIMALDPRAANDERYLPSVNYNLNQTPDESQKQMLLFEHYKIISIGIYKYEKWTKTETLG